MKFTAIALLLLLVIGLSLGCNGGKKKPKPVVLCKDRDMSGPHELCKLCNGMTRVCTTCNQPDGHTGKPHMCAHGHTWK